MRELVAAALLLAVSARAETLEGRNAIPGRQAAVTATLTLQPAVRPTILDVTMTKLGATSPIRDFEPELTKRMHLIAVDAGLTSFVHEHAAAPGADGHFRVKLAFPHDGAWHVYADAVPAGLGQQVMRFDVNVGHAHDVVTPLLWPGPLDLAEGRYSARFDSLALSPQHPTMLALHLLRDGTPAPDLAPFLGVAAHVVLIGEAGLDYVHVHPADPGDAPAAMDHMEHTDHHPDHTAARAADVALHVPPVAAGAYALWVQFNAGGRLHTMRFVARSD